MGIASDLAEMKNPR